MSEATLRRAADSLLPLLVGVVIGFLGSMATFSGRVARIETTVEMQSASIKTIAEQVGQLREDIATRRR